MHVFLTFRALLGGSESPHSEYKTDCFVLQRTLSLFLFFVLFLKLKTVRDSGVQHCGAQENNSQVPGVLIIVLFQSGIKYKGDKSVSTRVEGR